MRFQPLALAALLFACADPQENQVNETENDLAADMDGTDGAPVGDDGAATDGTPDGDAPDDGAPDTGSPDDDDPALPPPAPGTPPPQDPAPPAPEPEPERSVTLGASPARVPPGATVTLTLTNGLRQRIGYNLCTSGLIRNGAPVETGRICTMELRTLRPGASTTYGWELPDNLAPGNYRFTTGVERMRSGNRLVVRSNAFRVTR